ncbi:cytochrome P450 [Bradyrhizobium sp. KBS0727]|uniref:cytochrome P450 n=1 Tax=unclassified Bradyrhizobium TaxID=2631580 RepID=UPI00110DC07F|nr:MULTISPECIES: cytochrome P450 [unclassified Bradyrhizobium]QDW40583.1 cytochrome P450 [Bradyrhizobium sp. KBS0725]QDW47188.1 cytochrome P450 [Bradyrhizobium sp. KBS0727]
MSLATKPKLTCPAIDDDQYDDKFLLDPYPLYERLREAGPVVRMTYHGTWGMGRYSDVEAGLRNHETFVSGRGAGLADFKREKPWRPLSMLLESDPPNHTKSRSVLSRILSPVALRKFQEKFTAEAEARADEFVRQGTFDVIGDLAEPYISHVFPNIIGMPQEGRENLLKYSTMAFNAFGPKNKHYEAAVAQVGNAVTWVTDGCKRASLSPGSIGAQVFEAVDAGTLTEAEGELLVRSFMTAGLDTTIAGVAALFRNLSEHPEQWAVLRADHKLVRNAFDETLRYSAISGGVYRTVGRDTVLAGVKLAEGDKIWFSTASANRDPRRWQDPNRFDIRRQTQGHFGFGTGIHGCIGQMISRMEVEALLRAFVTRVRRVELDEYPVRKLSNSVRGYEKMRVRVTAD